MADRWKLIDKLREKANLASPQDIPDNAFGASDYAKRYRVCASTARAQLSEMTRKGQLKSGRKLENGRWVKFYWVAK